MEPQSAPLVGTFLHAIGAASAALCYSPQRYLRRWSWQTYWLAQAAACWFVLPWVFAWITIPHLGQVLSEAPGRAMVNSYLLGAVYGVGGIAFGVAIRYVGFSLTYAIAIGVSCVLGTLLPPLVAGRLGATFSSTAGGFVVGGVLLGTGAMLATGWAGLRKERELSEGGSKTRFEPRTGLPLCLLAGCLSAVFNFSLLAGQPVADVAARLGAGYFQGNVIYIFSNGGAFTTTLFYAGALATRAGSWGEFVRPGGPGLLRNHLLALATGLMWYLQFFFYGLGHVRMGEFKFSSWAIHMIILILLSCGFGVAIGEWRPCRRSTKLLVSGAIALLLGAVGLISYGNNLASPSGG
ncbi:MAG TPA: L-rhamnose/proton symporter RhaT [Opitutaceae bacterium]|jgi:L-rhamnose-H+ transport protein